MRSLIKKIVDEAKAARVLPAKDPMEEIVEKIRVAQCNWREQYPGCESPWDAFYLEVVTREDGSKYIGFNPSHQRHLSIFGANTVEDFQNWLDGKVVEGGIIKSQEAWDELLWICKTGSTAIWIGYEIEYFNGYQPEYLLAPGRKFIKDGVEIIGKGLPKKMQETRKNHFGYEEKMMTPKLIEVVEKYVKWIYKKDMEDQLAFSYKNVDIYNVRIRREAEEEVYGFMYALGCLGLETQDGASNTPKVRENFAWWRNLLQMEAKWDLWIEKGVAYEPWVKNRKSTYSRKED